MHPIDFLQQGIHLLQHLNRKFHSFLSSIILLRAKTTLRAASKEEIELLPDHPQTKSATLQKAVNFQQARQASEQRKAHTISEAALQLHTQAQLNHQQPPGRKLPVPWVGSQVASQGQANQLLDHFGPLFASIPISDAEVAAYLALKPYDAAQGWEMISEQYWAATLLNEYEAFSN